MATKLIGIILLFSVNFLYGQTPSTKDTCTSKEHVYFILDVDKLPIFKYENMTAMEYIYKNLNWPTEFDGQGTVIVSFIIKKNGEVCNVNIEKTLSFECDNEVKRVINSMPKWKPAKKNNKFVNVSLYIPIKFRIN